MLVAVKGIEKNPPISKYKSLRNKFFGCGETVIVLKHNVIRYAILLTKDKQSQVIMSFGNKFFKQQSE